MFRLLKNSKNNFRFFSTRNGAALIVGAGESTGGAISKKFAREGLTACVVRRNGEKLQPLVNEIEKNGGKAIAYGVDCRKEEKVIQMVADIELNVAPIEVAVFNVGANIRHSILETTARQYYKVWEMACFSGFLVGKEVAKHMIKRKKGTIIFTGATASIRGGNGFSAFSGAKHALRALSQSMARELGPLGIHVAHVVIDGAIDTPWIRENFPQSKDLSKDHGLLLPDAIAENYWHLHQQPKNAFTHELDLRPWKEKW